jgi:kynurenine formamidase
MPRVSAELARWLVERQINLLGVQTPSVASLRPEHREELTEVHQILLRAEIVIVEGLANLDQVRREVVTFIALPLKVTGCDGSPVRPVAIEEE